MQFNFNNITQAKLNEAKVLIHNKGGHTYTDQSFKVSGVEGRYWLFDSGRLVIIIDKKPFLASWGMIEAELTKFFS